MPGAPGGRLKRACACREPAVEAIPSPPLRGRMPPDTIELRRQLKQTLESLRRAGLTHLPRNIAPVVRRDDISPPKSETSTDRETPSMTETISIKTPTLARVD